MGEKSGGGTRVVESRVPLDDVRFGSQAEVEPVEESQVEDFGGQLSGYLRQATSRLYVGATQDELR